MQDISLSRETKVDLVIGCNVLEAFCVLKERRGDKGDPYVIRSLLAWTLIRPMDRLECKGSHYCVNFTRIVSAEKEDVLT